MCKTKKTFMVLLRNNFYYSIKRHRHKHFLMQQLSICNQKKISNQKSIYHIQNYEDIPPNQFLKKKIIFKIN